MGMMLKTYLFVNKENENRRVMLIDSFVDKRAEERVMELMEECPVKLYDWEYVKIDETHPMYLKPRETLLEIVDTERDYGIAHA
jgi:hypothetical protein